jgi:asparagine synthase (glutamine-hydrolysing)
MADRQSHRGPDDSGVWVDPTGYCAFSHRRLSIIDTSSAGHQPMHSADGLATITFNGEIYNFDELRPVLESRGKVFRTRTDTEVLLEMVRTFGAEAFPRMDGMYAFALFDSISGEVIIGRDPFGEKPLYFTQQGGCFAFASELHCLPFLPGFDDEIDPEAIAQYFLLQYIPSPRTLYRSVSKLPPAHFMRIRRNGEISLHRYFEFAPVSDPQPSASLDELADELEDILVTTTQRRLMSDVPLGAFLSGGVDSSVVVAIMSKILGRTVDSFSIGFADTEESEHLAAREMARHLGTTHHEKMLKPDALAMADVIASALDEPNADSSCLPTYLLSQFAREHVTVSLSGDGGDEMFGGYGRYFMTVEEERAGGANWNPGNAYFSERVLMFAEQPLRDLLGEIPEQTRELLARLRSDVNQSRPPLLARLRRADVETYLPGAVLAKVDRMSMQHSLEVRCPILSMEVARFAEKLAVRDCYEAGQGKRVLKRVASRYIPRPWLERSKKGFGLPMNSWGRQRFAAQLRSLCAVGDSRIRAWLPVQNIERFIKRQENPNTFSMYQSWTMLMLELWLRNLSGEASSVLPVWPFRRVGKNGIRKAA